VAEILEARSERRVSELGVNLAERNIKFVDSYQRPP
jgi:hypothetical protein